MARKPRHLAYPIKLRDGRVIENLDQAAHLLMNVSDDIKKTDTWAEAATLVPKAMKSPKAIEAATDQLASALQWWGFK